MRKLNALLIVFVLVFSIVPASHFASAMYGTKVIDGNINDWTSSDLVAVGRDNGQAGANLDRLYVAWDDQYLYIAIKTNNTQSWDVAYGIGIDVDPGTGKGYNGTSDSWGRNIEFANGFAIDYEIYFWWNGTVGAIKADNFNTWTGSGWDYKSIAAVGGEFSYTGNASTGLKTLEIKIPWSALGGRPNETAIMAWVTGSGGSAVDSLPVDPAIDYSNLGNEWGDTDTFTNLAVIYVGTKTIDGDLSDWSNNEIAAIDEAGVGVPGGNLSKLYVSWDKDYLYLVIVTNNTANWAMAYGFGIDIDPGTGNGYTGGEDAWGRQINFTNGYAVDYEVYFWWNDTQAKITAAQLNPYNGGWSWPSLEDVGGKYAYTGNSSTGLKTLEVAIPWSAIGGMHSHFAVSAWVTGRGGSAVDILPQESAAADNADEWNDVDVISQMAEFEMFLMPDLKVDLTGPGVAGLNRTTIYNVTVENGGSLPANNVSVRVYINDAPYANWTTDLGAGEKKWFTFTWKPNQTGVYTIKATVDEENKIPEANEDNNVATMNVEVIWVGKINVDGDPSDWPTAKLGDNNYTVVNGTFIWIDKIGDNRKDKDQYLPGETSSHADLTEVAVTKDDRYVYFMFRFANMSNIKIGDNGATFVAVPIDYKEGGADWMAGRMDTRTSFLWDVQMAVNLKCNQDIGKRSAIESAGNSLTSMLYFVDPDGNVLTVNGAVVGVDLSKDTIEVRVPVWLFENRTKFNFTVATGLSYGEGVWNFGDPFNDDTISDAVDVLSVKSTEDEVEDGYLDYAIQLETNGIVENAKSIDYEQIRMEMQRKEEEKKRRERWNHFINLNKYYGATMFKEYYMNYTYLDQYLRNQTLTSDMAEKLSEYENEVAELLSMYNEGMKLIKSDSEVFTGAVEVFRAYTGLIKIVKEMQKMKELVEMGIMKRQAHIEELSKKLTKKIDGNLDDWNVQPVAVDTEGYGQDGANLKALYVDYDDNFLYIALTTYNKASWRVVYGISLDYKDGGYTTGQDSWGKKLSFTRGIDAQLYFFWNGEFFGDLGTSTITSAQLVIWNGSGWDYKDLQWVGFYNYTGGAENGLQTLEIAIPWEELGGKPKEINIVAYVTGMGVGDSAVDSLPLQEAVRDKQPGDEWSDEDTFTEFASVTIT